MKHIILIDPIEKLTIQKDSTIYFSNTLKKNNCEIFYLFKDDLFISTNRNFQLRVNRPFFKEQNGIVQEVNFVDSPEEIKLEKGDVIHMRLEPPFDTNYLRILWMLDYLKKGGVEIINDPKGIMNFQEKIFPLTCNHVIESAVVQKYYQVVEFLKSNELVTEFIFKPLDLFQGIGVTKVQRDRINEEFFKKLVRSYNGVALVQPFIKKVLSGEIRSIYFKGSEIGSIIKTPPQGSFLANIAQGAKYEKVLLGKREKSICEDLSKKLMSAGVPWVAFDILEEKISEANTTCPGLLVEVSNAYKENLAEKILKLL